MQLLVYTRRNQKLHRWKANEKRLFAGAILFALVLTMALPASAASITSTDANAGYLIISDPSTGEKWSWELSASDIMAAKISSCDGISESNQTSEVTVNIGEHLLQTIAASANTEQTLYDDYVNNRVQLLLRHSK